MKKMMMLALALVMMLTLTGAALAESAPMSKEDQMKNMVQGFLDENGYEYEYDDYTFSMSFALENALEYVNVMVFVDDDMLSVVVDAPIQGEEAAFEPLAVLTTLINSEIFYALITPTTSSMSPAAPAIWWRTLSPAKTSCII